MTQGNNNGANNGNSGSIQQRIQNIRSNNTQNTVGTKTPAYYQLKKDLHHQLLNDINPEDLQNESNHSQIKHQIVQIVNVIAAEKGLPLSPEQKVSLLNELTDEVLGFGPLETLLRDKSISEIMINGHRVIFVERSGKIIKLGEQIFESEDHLQHIVKRIALRIGRRVDQSSPMVDARLPDGSRVNAVIPPLALDGTTVTIRKFPDNALKLQDLINYGAVTENMGAFMELCVRARMNMIVAGGTGSGKTTLLNLLSGYIQNTDRVITIEDSAELRLQQEHVVRLETRPANAEGVGEVTARDLVKNALRMRPNRVVVGECRSGETLDMLQAMNTGHEGSMTTVHANTSRDTMKRVETLVLMSGVDLPLKTVREMIASTINIVCLQSRFSDGSRKIKQISEVVGMEGDVITLQDIFVYKQTGLDENGKVVGFFQPTGVLPKCVPHMKSQGFEVPMELFAPNGNAPRGQNNGGGLRY